MDFSIETLTRPSHTTLPMHTRTDLATAERQDITGDIILIFRCGDIGRPENNKAVMEPCVSTMDLNPATPNSAKSPQTQILNHRAVPTLSPSCQQARSMEPQTNHRDISTSYLTCHNLPASTLPCNRCVKTGQMRLNEHEQVQTRFDHQTQEKDISCYLGIVRTSAILK